MNREIIEGLRISMSATIKEALKLLDESSHRVLFVTEADGTMLGSLSDGDVRRAILAGKELSEPVSEVYNRQPQYFLENDYDIERCREVLIKQRIQLIPLVDGAMRIVDCVGWEDVLAANGKKKPQPEPINVPVVVMAGGKGTRLAPFTHVLPKPLIPIGDRTIIEVIFDNFRQHGVRRFFITLNYRGEMIKAYLDGAARDYEIEYVWEREFLGTAGSLLALRDSIADTFIVTNCDILVKADYADVVRFHEQSGAALTIVSSIQHIAIPYGVVVFQNGGEVTGIVEKPEYSYPINTGAYVLNKEALEHIPENSRFDMTELIERLVSSGRKVVTYPVNEKQYMDIGEWDQYRKSLQNLSFGED